MRLSLKSLFAVAAIFFVAAGARSSPTLHEKRQNPSDLEVSGALVGLPPDSTRYITHNELMAMPLVSFTASGDTNFTGPTKITGVKLDDLARALGASRASDMVVAICDDEYRANYPRAYLAARIIPCWFWEVDGKPPGRMAKGFPGTQVRYGAVHDFKPQIYTQLQDSLA